MFITRYGPCVLESKFPGKIKDWRGGKPSRKAAKHAEEGEQAEGPRDG